MNLCTKKRNDSNKGNVKKKGHTCIEAEAYGRLYDFAGLTVAPLCS